jgi:hypothetical protein
VYANANGLEADPYMESRNTTLYDKLRRCIEDACKDSLSWRPHATKYQNLIESILAEEIVRRNIEWWSPDRPVADEAESWLAHFFNGYQDETEKGLVWNAEAFDHVYSKLEKFLYQDSYTSHFVSPLKPFSFDSSASVELETGVYIRKPDNFLSNILRNQELNIEHSSDTGNWVVYIFLEQPKSAKREAAHSNPAKANKKLRMVLQSLRLLHKGKVFVGPLYYLTYPEFAGLKRNIGALLDTGLTTLSLMHLSYFASTGYELREQELEELKAIYRLVAKEATHYPDPLALALSRFHDYFSRTSEADGLLDLVIALEALFSGKGQEIGYSLALRCSYFLEPDFQKRKEIFSQLRNMYEVRSSIVHGRPGVPKRWRKLWSGNSDTAFVLMVDNAEDYVRQAIRKVIVDKHLDKFQNATDWRKFLDDLVLKGSA